MLAICSEGGNLGSQLSNVAVALDLAVGRVLKSTSSGWAAWTQAMPRPLKGNENRPVEGLRAALQSLRQQQEPEQQQTANQKSKRHELTFKYLSYEFNWVHILLVWLDGKMFLHVLTAFTSCVSVLFVCVRPPREHTYFGHVTMWIFAFLNSGSSWMTVRMLQEPLRFFAKFIIFSNLSFSCKNECFQNDQPSWRFDSWLRDTIITDPTRQRLLRSGLQQEQSLAAIEALLETCDTEIAAPERAAYAIKDIDLLHPLKLT